MHTFRIRAPVSSGICTRTCTRARTTVASRSPARNPMKKTLIPSLRSMHSRVVAPLPAPLGQSVLSQRRAAEAAKSPGENCLHSTCPFLQSFKHRPGVPRYGLRTASALTNSARRHYGRLQYSGALGLGLTELREVAGCCCSRAFSFCAPDPNVAE